MKFATPDYLFDHAHEFDDDGALFQRSPAVMHVQVGGRNACSCNAQSGIGRGIDPRSEFFGNRRPTDAFVSDSFHVPSHCILSSRVKPLAIRVHPINGYPIRRARTSGLPRVILKPLPLAKYSGEREIYSTGQSSHAVNLNAVQDCTRLHTRQVLLLHPLPRGARKSHPGKGAGRGQPLSDHFENSEAPDVATGNRGFSMRPVPQCVLFCSELRSFGD